MKACIVLQNQFAKIGHAVACRLKESYGVNEFCAYVYSPRTLAFIKNQKDINYKTILADHKLHEQYKKEKVDKEYLRQFESKYLSENPWHPLYVDRKLMMSIGPKEETTVEIDPLYCHEDLLKIFQVRARAIEKMLHEERPDFILFFPIGAIGNLLMFQIAQELGIKTLIVDFARFSNYISISENYRTLTGAEKIFNDNNSRKGGSNQYAEQALRLIDNFKKTKSLDLQYVAFSEAVVHKKNILLLPRNFIRSIKYIWILTRNFKQSGRLFTYGTTNENPLRFILHKIRQKIRKTTAMKNLTSAPVPGEDYAFYALHYEPEMATLLLSPFYFDQLELIRYLARSLPLYFKLYVKEHPAMRGKRPRKFYKEMLKIPNVRLIDQEIKSFDLIKNAKLVATISGTVGWEATLLEKPVITFGDVFFNCLSFVKRIHDIEMLPRLVRQQLEQFNYEKREVVNLTAAIIEDSFQFDWNALWYENDAEKLKINPQVNIFCQRLMAKARN